MGERFPLVFTPADHHRGVKPRGGQFKDIFHALILSADEWLAAADMSGQVIVYKA